MFKTHILMNRSNGKYSVQIRLSHGYIFYSEEYEKKEEAEEALKLLIQEVKNK